MKEFDREEQAIYNALSHISADTSRLQETILEKAKNGDKVISYKVKHTPIKRLITVAAVIVTIALLTVAVGAAGGFDWFMARFNLKYVDVVEPVGIACEEEGIRMEVIAAQRYGNSAVVYLSLQDVTGKNRLTETTDFMDGFYVSMGEPKQEETPSDEGTPVATVYSFGWTKNVIGFDEKTNTLYLEFIIESDIADLESRELTIGTSIIYFQDARYEDTFDISLSDLEVPSTQLITGAEMFTQGYNEDGVELTRANSLVTGHMGELSFGNGDSGDRMWFSNAGIIDGEFHVQVGYLFSNKPFGYGGPTVFLSESADDDLYAESSISSHNDYSFITNEDGKIQRVDKFEDGLYRYDEFVFDVGEDDLDSYFVKIHCFYSDGVEGKWRVATSLNESSEELYKWEGEEEIDGCTITNFTLSPIALSMSGYCAEGSKTIDELSISVETENGIIELGSSSGSYGADGNTFDCTWTASEPFDLSSANAIIINGISIPLE